MRVMWSGLMSDYISTKYQHSNLFSCDIFQHKYRGRVNAAVGCSFKYLPIRNGNKNHVKASFLWQNSLQPESYFLCCGLYKLQVLGRQILAIKAFATGYPVQVPRVVMGWPQGLVSIPALVMALGQKGGKKGHKFVQLLRTEPSLAWERVGWQSQWCKGVILGAPPPTLGPFLTAGRKGGFQDPYSVICSWQQAW